MITALAVLMKRVNVIGTSGTGKSTFSKKLAEKLEVPYLEMDRIFWLKNWEEPSNEVFFPKLEAELTRILHKKVSRVAVKPLKVSG